MGQRLNKTAAQWLESELKKLPFVNIIEVFKQAKEIEKEQIITAYKSDRTPCSDEDAEQYYKDTYGSNT